MNVASYPLRGRDLIPRTKSVWLLIAVHLVGGLGFAAIPDLFVRLVPLHLLFCLAVWLVNQPQWRVSLALWIAACGLFGFLAEVLGVKTSLIFGSYRYGPTLGPALWEVPLMMAVNWSLLTSIMADLSAEWREARGWGPLRGALAGALALVALDLFLEPFAVRYDLWTWEGERVPFRNYIGWGVISFGLLLVYHGRGWRPRNPVSGWLFAVLFAFFASALLVGGGGT